MSQRAVASSAGGAGPDDRRGVVRKDALHRRKVVDGAGVRSARRVRGQRVVRLGKAIAVVRLQPHIPIICLSRPNALATIMRIQLVHVCSVASRSTCRAICLRIVDDAMASENAASHSTWPDVMM